MNAFDLAQRPGTWEIEGRWVMTDEETCDIKYIGRITDCNQFDSLFAGMAGAQAGGQDCDAAMAVST
jgi:hypothetical protein